MSLYSHVRCAFATDIGRKRKNNEDNLFVDHDAGLFAVADGMGGGDDGEVASAAVAEALRKCIERRAIPAGKTWPVDVLLDGVAIALDEASAAVFARARELGLKSCGSTCAGFQLDAANPARGVAFHAGDSRLYRIRDGRAQRLTRDHSPAGLMGVEDESTLNPMFRGVVLRAVGIEERVELERTPFDVRPGDKFLLCTDGLYRMVPADKIAVILSVAANPQTAAAQFVQAANEAGGVDNITAVVAEIGPLPAPVPVDPADGVPRYVPVAQPSDDAEAQSASSSVAVSFASAESPAASSAESPRSGNLAYSDAGIGLSVQSSGQSGGDDLDDERAGLRNPHVRALVKRACRRFAIWFATALLLVVSGAFAYVFLSGSK